MLAAREDREEIDSAVTSGGSGDVLFVGRDFGRHFGCVGCVLSVEEITIRTTGLGDDYTLILFSAHVNSSSADASKYFHYQHERFSSSNCTCRVCAYVTSSNGHLGVRRTLVSRNSWGQVREMR